VRAVVDGADEHEARGELSDPGYSPPGFTARTALAPGEREYSSRTSFVPPECDDFSPAPSPIVEPAHTRRIGGVMLRE